MATYCVSRDLLTWFFEGTRRVLLSACTVALVSCGGGQSGPAAPPVDSVGPVGPSGANTSDGPSIALNTPATVGPSNRIALTWQAPSSLTSFTVFVQRAADQAFEAVDAAVAGQSAQFARGAAYRLDFPTARVRVHGCDDLESMRRQQRAAACRCVARWARAALCAGLHAVRQPVRAGAGCAQCRWQHAGVQQSRLHCGVWDHWRGCRLPTGRGRSMDARGGTRTHRPEHQHPTRAAVRIERRWQHDRHWRWK